jgi:hypothetical protein
MHCREGWRERVKRKKSSVMLTYQSDLWSSADDDERLRRQELAEGVSAKEQFNIFFRQ